VKLVLDRFRLLNVGGFVIMLIGAGCGGEQRDEPTRTRPAIPASKTSAWKTS
jgi:hypothetical protein